MVKDDDTQEEKSPKTDTPESGADEEAKGGEDTEEELTDEAKADLIKKGQEFTKLQKDHPKVDFNEMPKAFTQATQELSEFKRKPSTVEKGNEPDPIEKAMDDLKYEGKDREYFKTKIMPIVTAIAKKEAQAIAEAKIKERSDQDDVDSEIKTMTKKYDGKDGLPVFDKDDIMAYAQKQRIFNLEAAYRHKHHAEIIQNEIESSQNKKKPFVEKPGAKGIRLPSGKKLSFDDGSVKKATEESLTKMIESRSE